MIAVIEYGMGNARSIENMLRRIGVPVEITSSPKVIEAADKLVLPGVGAFDVAMQNLRNMGLIPVLDRAVLNEHKPVLGICLGMQLMGRRSEEGLVPGLGWIQAETRRFTFNDDHGHLKIPHMGWNLVRGCKSDEPLFTGFEVTPRFYFVHSYHVCCDRSTDIIATCVHGYEFVAAVRSHKIIGTQFHPEKSHKFGMRFLMNFVKYI